MKSARRLRMFPFRCVCGGVRAFYDEELKQVKCGDCKRVTPDSDGAILIKERYRTTERLEGLRIVQVEEKRIWFSRQ